MPNWIVRCNKGRIAMEKGKKISEMTYDEIMDAIDDGIFDDKAFIKDLEEKMSPDDKKDPLFLAYKASVISEEERTAEESIYLKTFEMAFELSELLVQKPDGLVGFKDGVDSELNEALDNMHKKYEEVTGRKMPKWREK